MNPRYSALVLSLALLGSNSHAAEEPEVLARGPVHEAYAEPTEREPAPTPIVNKEPPKPIEELPPDQKPEGDNVQWIPGYWSYDEDRKDYIWVSGFWRVAPPNRTWVPGSWRKAGDGWQWSGGFWMAAKDQKAEVEYLPKPPAPLDNDGANTPAPSEAHIYVPGSWIWRDRYVWRPGFWMEHREGWVWTPAHYRWTPGGYVYIDGYWDYPLVTRGTLFAPVYIPPVVYTAPTYVYTPTVYVREECLFGAFFARRGWGCYYFGDYFEPRYSTVGFVAWSGHVSATVRIGGYYDPLFSYYRCGYRSDPFWGGGGCVNLFVGRYRGDYARPPRTLVQQTTVINNITNNNITNIDRSRNNTTVVQNSNLNNVTMLSSIRDGNRDGRRFQQVPDSARRDQQVAARDFQTVAARRADAETRLAQGRGPKGGNTGPQRVGLEVPPARTVQTPLGKGGLGAGGTGTPMPKGGLGVGGNTTPKGGLGMGDNTPMPKGGNSPFPKGGLGAGGTNPMPKGGLGVGGTNPLPKGNNEPPLPKATPIGRPDPKGITIPPRGGALNPPATGGSGLPMPKAINNPPVNNPLPKGGNIPPASIGNPQPTPKGNNIPPAGIGNPLPKANNNPRSTLPKGTSNPPATLPIPKAINNPPVNNPPMPKANIAPPATTPKASGIPPTTIPKSGGGSTVPKVTPKTRSSFEPAPTAIRSSTPTPPPTSPRPTAVAPRPALTSPARPAVVAPTVQPRPAVTAPVRPAPTVQPRPATVAPRALPAVQPRPATIAPRPATVAPRALPAVQPRPATIAPRPATIAPRPTINTAPRPTISPRPAMVNPRPAPSIAPRSTPIPSRPSAIPNGAGRRPIRR